MSEKIWLSWNDDRVYWSGGPVGTIDFVWKDVYIILDEAANLLKDGHPGLMPEEDPWRWLDKKMSPKIERPKRQEVKKAIIRVNGLGKEKKKYTKITVDHIKNTFKHFGISVNLDSDIRESSKEENKITPNNTNVIVSDPTISSRKNDDI